MSGYLIDLFFSFKGTASRRDWLLGTAALAVAAAGGLLLFNDDGFDESVNALPDVPTMAAFLWALLCLFAFSALSTKRLREAGHGRWAAATVALPALLLVCGWGVGYFLTPFSARLESLIFWVLLAVTLPALRACADRLAEIPEHGD